MTEIVAESLDNYRKEPWRLVMIARSIAEDDVQPPEDLEAMLSAPDRPIIGDLPSASAPLWDLLSVPDRDKGLRWLDRTGLLQNLFPCWSGNAARRNLRLDAVEQIHLETWKEGLSEASVSKIMEAHDVVVDGRSNGWSLTSLGTLLAGGDTENQYFWSKMVRRNMFELGATEAEILWIEEMVIDYRRAIQFLRGEMDSFNLSPQLSVTILSTMLVGGEDSPDEIKQAAQKVNQTL